MSTWTPRMKVDGWGGSEAAMKQNIHSTSMGCHPWCCPTWREESDCASVHQLLVFQLCSAFCLPFVGMMPSAGLYIRICRLFWIYSYSTDKPFVVVFSSKLYNSLCSRARRPRWRRRRWRWTRSARSAARSPTWWSGWWRRSPGGTKTASGQLDLDASSGSS